MRKIAFILNIILLLYSSVQGQNGEKVTFSIVREMNIDSVIVLKNLKLFPAHEDTVFHESQVATPEKALQAYMSFKTKEWGEKIASVGYSGYFPSNSKIENNNSPEYHKKAYCKVYFIVYFNYQKQIYAACYNEQYVNTQFPQYMSMIIYRFVGNRWLLANDWYLSRFKDLGKLKPKYALALVQGKTLKNENLYNELYREVYSDGKLDLGVLQNLVIPRIVLLGNKDDKPYYKELRNEYK